MERGAGAKRRVREEAEKRWWSERRRARRKKKERTVGSRMRRGGGGGCGFEARGEGEGGKGATRCMEGRGVVVVEECEGKERQEDTVVEGRRGWVCIGTPGTCSDG